MILAVMKEEIKTIIVQESLKQSIYADIVTFGCMCATMIFNHTVCGDSVAFDILLIVSIVIWSFRKGSKKIKVMEPKEALEYLKERLENK